MRSFKTVMSVWAVLCLFAINAYCADSIKIGVVDFERVFKESTIGKKIKSEIEASRDTMSGDLKKKQVDIQKLQEDYQKEKMVLSQDKLADREREMNIKIYDLNMLKKKYENDMQKVAFEKTENLKKQLLDIADGYGRKESFTLIVEKNSIVYSASKMDITDAIIRLLNAAPAK